MKETSSNGLAPIIAQAVEEMKAEQGKNFSLEQINLAELGRRTGLSRAKLRRLKENGFKDMPHGLAGHRPLCLVAIPAFWTSSFKMESATLPFVSDIWKQRVMVEARPQ